MTEILASEWKPALGCTEPAAVAWAAALASEQGQGAVRQVHLLCDPRTFKNCYAVGLPNAEHATGILWALALGAYLPDGSLGLRSFEGVDPTVLASARSLLQAQRVEVEVATLETALRVEVTVERDFGVGRAVLEREHTHLARLEKDGQLVGGAQAEALAPQTASVYQAVAALSIQDLMALALTLTPEDRARLQEGIQMNLAMAQHGLDLLPPGFNPPAGPDAQTQSANLVSAGVYARMSGAPLPVMTLAGSGNKGITVTVPVSLRGREAGLPEGRIEEALAFACLMTTAATWHLGTLSAICGAANAAGIGIASALVFLEGGSSRQVGLAIANMVGNLAGMICDGAKIGCAMKTMTGSDAAFRAARLALADIGIPATDGIVGEDGASCLVNLGRLAQRGMVGVDEEILGIMQDKLRQA
jgi:L-cysteine desulfidase